MGVGVLGEAGRHGQMLTEAQLFPKGFSPKQRGPRLQCLLEVSSNFDL